MDKAFAYHRPSTTGLEDITHLRNGFSDLKQMIETLCRPSRERSIALTGLESAAMWAIKALVFNDPNSVVEDQHVG